MEEEDSWQKFFFSNFKLDLGEKKYKLLTYMEPD